jgi:hypothetical protein
MNFVDPLSTTECCNGVVWGGTKKLGLGLLKKKKLKDKKVNFKQ